MHPRLLRSTCLCAVVLSAAFGPARPSLLLAQASTATSPQAAPKALFIEILAGEGDVNDIRARTAREPIVEVQDENHRPVAGALVLFESDPSSGTQLVSFSGSRSLQVYTGLDGRAVAQGFQTTRQTGQVRILVKAMLGTVVAETVLHQQNFTSANKLQRQLTQHKRLYTSSALVAGAAIALSVVLTRDHGATISAGTGVVRGVRPARP